MSLILSSSSSDSIVGCAWRCCRWQTPTGEWDVRLKFEFGLSTQHYANVQKHGIVDALHAKRWAGANHPAETLESPMPAVHAMKLT